MKSSSRDFFTVSATKENGTAIPTPDAIFIKGNKIAIIFTGIVTETTKSFYSTWKKGQNRKIYIFTQTNLVASSAFWLTHGIINFEWESKWKLALLALSEEFSKGNNQ